MLFATTSGHVVSSRATAATLQDYALLRKLGRWLPALLHLHRLLGTLCAAAADLDAFRATLVTHSAAVCSAEGQTLGSIPSLVEGMRGVFASFSDATLDFVATLADCPALVQWLLAHANQQEFNQMLNVVRPCTDEPRMLSAIASLVFVRTLLIEPLYSGPPYQDLTVRPLLRSLKLLFISCSVFAALRRHDPGLVVSSYTRRLSCARSRPSS